jgi:hypothetical protein
MSWMDRELFEKMIAEFEARSPSVIPSPVPPGPAEIEKDRLVALLKHLHQRLDQVETKVAFGGL